MNKRLWYKKPAKSFTEALPLGNGSMGAIVYGNLPQEHISLNMDTFWSGVGRREEEEVPKAHLDYVRQLIFSEKYYEAQKFIEQNMLGRYNESYMPLGDLYYKFTDVDQWTDYKRVLDLETATVTSEFQANGSKYQVEMFASYPGKLLALKINTSKTGAINLEFSLSSKVRYTTEYHSDGKIIMKGNAPSHVEPNYVVSETPIVYDENHMGMPFACCCRTEIIDGEISADSSKMQISNASSVVMYIFMENGYKNIKSQIDPDVTKCIQRCLERMGRADIEAYEQIRKEHIEDYQSIFMKTVLELSEDSNDEPTDVRLKNFKEGKEDQGLYSLFFDYNRYLMISSSRKGSQPANLQGIWNESIRPVWSSNWTININTQMNYWPTCSCNMAECYEPLISMLEEMSITGQETARKQFHCGGWAANHNIDLWRHTEPVGGDAKYAYWPMGGVWLSAQIYEYYEYTLDKVCLQERIYPVMRGAVQFCLDWLVKGNDGRYHTAPATSPENTFLDENGNECGVSYSSTMDLSIIRELFKNFKAANEALGIQDSLVEQIEEREELMPDFQIDQNGLLQEWIRPFREADPGHRHFSPIFSFHPGSIFEDMQMKDACKKLIERRVANHHLQIGWSCAWLINLWAKFGYGNKAEEYLRTLLKMSVYDNLFDLHPPLGEGPGEREVFQIDGNFGSASGITAMLVQSKTGEIHILPALPDNWKNGSVKGLLAHGNVTVDVVWKDGKMEVARLTSPFSQKIKLHVATSGFTQEIMLKENEVYELTV